MEENKIQMEENKIQITGVITEDNIEVDTHGLETSDLLATITVLIGLLLDGLNSDENKEITKEILKDIAENPQRELKKQFVARAFTKMLMKLFGSKSEKEED